MHYTANLLNLLFNPKGKISNNVFFLGVGLSLAVFFLLASACVLGRIASGFQGTVFNVVFGFVLISFLYQFAVLIAKRVNDMGFGVFAGKIGKRVLNLFLLILRLGALMAFITLLALVWRAFQIPEKIDVTQNLRIMECTAPFGSWFNQNELTMKPGLFEYEQKGFLGVKIESIPYSRIRKIVFTDGLIWNRMVIETGRIPFSGKEMYILNDSNFQLVRDGIYSATSKYLILEENRTILQRLKTGLRQVISGPPS